MSNIETRPTIRNDTIEISIERGHYYCPRGHDAIFTVTHIKHGRHNEMIVTPWNDDQKLDLDRAVIEEWEAWR